MRTLKGGNACFKTCKKSCKCRKLCNESLNDLSYLKLEFKKAKEKNKELHDKVMEKLKQKLERDYSSLPHDDKTLISNIITNPNLKYDDKQRLIQSLRTKYQQYHFGFLGGKKTKRKTRKRGGFFDFLDSAKKHDECEEDCEKNCDTSCNYVCNSVNKIMSKKIKDLELFDKIIDENKSLEHTLSLL